VITATQKRARRQRKHSAKRAERDRQRPIAREPLTGAVYNCANAIIGSVRLAPSHDHKHVDFYCPGCGRHSQICEHQYGFEVECEITKEVYYLHVAPMTHLVERLIERREKV
jgi:hypothetical protein